MENKEKPLPRSWILRNWALVAGTLFSGFFFLAAVYISAHRLEWYDEVVTAIVSRQPRVQDIVYLLKQGVDAQPVPFYLLVRLSSYLLGATALALRLPMALALFAGLMVSFDCARRLTDGLHGLIALTLLSCSVLPFYGSEARPYALVFLWVSCSLWLWFHTSRGSWPAALCFGITVFCSLESHYYAVFCLIPYGLVSVWEFRRKGIPPKLVAGAVAAFAGLALLIPFAGKLRGMSGGFWAAASMTGLDGIFTDLFSHLPFLFALVLLWMTIADFCGSRTPVPPAETPERLSLLFLTIPFFGFVAAKFVTNAFYHRYFIGVLCGFSVGFACLIWRYFRNSPVVTVGIVCILAVMGMLRSVSHVRHPELVGPMFPEGETERMTALMQWEDRFAADGRQFIVVPSDLVLALEGMYHSKHPEWYRLLETPTSNQHTLGYLTRRLNGKYPIQFWTLEDLKAHAPQSVLIEASETSEAEVLTGLQRLGVGFQFRQAYPIRIFYPQ